MKGASRARREMGRALARVPDPPPPCAVCGLPVYAPGRDRHHACDPAPLSEQESTRFPPRLFDR